MFERIPNELQLFPQWVASLFTYDKETEDVYFKARDFGEKPSPRQKQWNVRFAGKQAGYLSDKGYIRIRLPNGKYLYAHQIAFLLETGSIPDEIDHRDTCKTNNKFLNLRVAIPSGNACNVGTKKSNKIGIKGVSWAKSNGCWRMDIQYKGKKYHSYHATTDEAYAAYCAKSLELHREFGNVR